MLWINGRKSSNFLTTSFNIRYMECQLFESHASPSICDIKSKCKPRYSFLNLMW
jgi:hypothetical protein